MEPVFFEDAAAFRAWLAEHHATKREVTLGFRKKGSGIPGIAYGDAVDEALCFGWIDGVRRRLDEFSYSNRFTPRTKSSTWSVVNIRRVAELTADGRMTAAGRAVFDGRNPAKSRLYSFEQETIAFSPGYESTFRGRTAAWEFFVAQPPGYRRIAAWWVMSAKRDETRARRLETLMTDSAEGRRTAAVVRPTRREGESASINLLLE